MSGYVFIGNSTKPTLEKLNSRVPIKLDNVSKPCVKNALNMGYEVIVGINRNNPEELDCVDFSIAFYDSHTYRSITAVKDNYIAYKNLVNIVKHKDISVIHCNTPVGGLVGRLVGKKHRVKKVVYTAHGFHFYKGAPVFNRTIIKWAEQIMAHWTDAIITMNEEDFQAAKKFKLRRGGKVYKVHGVGINLSEYQDYSIDKLKMRETLGLKETDIVCISAGDIVSRKNYNTAIEAISKIKDERLHYLICGTGPEMDNLKNKTINLRIENRVHFLGFRSDIKELFKMSDIFLFSSLQEGLPRSLMEAMAIGLPSIVSNIRGNVDLIEDGKGGFLCEPKDANQFAEAIQKMINSSELRYKMSQYNLGVIKNYDIHVVEREIYDIYKAVL